MPRHDFHQGGPVARSLPTQGEFDHSAFFLTWFEHFVGLGLLYLSILDTELMETEDGCAQFLPSLETEIDR